MFKSTVKWIDLAIIFALELCMLVALAYWGVKTGSGAFGKIAYGVGAPVAIAVVWGVFAAPKAKAPLPVVARLAVKAIIFALAALALSAAGQRGLGIALFVCFCATQALALMLDD